VGTSSQEKLTHPVITSSTSTTQQQQQYQQHRRGSVPCGSVNGKRRNPKKFLRRRSSSGTIEILTPIVSESMESTSSNNASGNSAWYKFKKDWTITRRSDSDTLLTKRRGSLPIEVLAIGLGE
jgi:cAMP-specific phosphodiesterase 4